MLLSIFILPRSYNRVLQILTQNSLTAK